MSLYPPDFDKRAVALARRCTDDIVECDQAHVSVLWHGQAPYLRFVFALPPETFALGVVDGKPAFAVPLVINSRKDPLGPGRLLAGDELRRVVRDSIEKYFHANGLQISIKAAASYANG